MSYDIPSHPAAALFPLMDGNDLNRLVADIRENGLTEPIMLIDGHVLDGRNRLRACELAGVEPRFVEWQQNGVSPVSWAVRRNLEWRHLTNGQKAALALDLLPQLEADARDRQRGGQGGVLLSTETDEAKGTATEKAAELVGLGRTTIVEAKAIQDRDPEIINRMRAGEIKTVGAAKRAAGFIHEQGQGSLSVGVTDASGREMPAIYFGKGDKWTEASEPLRRYLAAFEKRGYEFSHVNPREARKRMKKIDALIEGLNSARAGLAERAHDYRLTA